MIVICPNCETRYLVDDAALQGAESRRVRCASCGHLWRYSPVSAAVQAAVAEATASAEATAAQPREAALPRGAAAPAPMSAAAEPQLRVDPRVDLPRAPGAPTALPRPTVEPELPAAARRRSARVTALVLTLIVAALVLIGIFSRERIMALWPATAPVYSALRLTETTGGLDVSVAPTRTPDSLVIDGDIVNHAQAARRIPKLRVTLHDGNNNDLESQVIDPPVQRLAPGATAHFNTVFEHPSITATGVAVSFASD